MGRLRRSDCSAPGISRRRRGRGFSYAWPDGTPVSDPDVRARIAALAVPPAWTDVWICPDPDGHLQAVGTDAAGRRQYRYHDRWRARRDAAKFDRVLTFARNLPTLREHVAADLDLEGLPRERVLACAVRLLDRGFFRTGGDVYAERHESFGLTTLLRRHVRLRGVGPGGHAGGDAGAGHAIVFDYQSKHGVRRVQTIVDAEALTVVRQLKRRRGGGEELLAWRDGGDGRWVDVSGEDLNEYLRERSGCDCTAKDFRTWSGTVLAAVALAVASPAATTPTARKRAAAHATREVAAYLGNTPAVARASYIDPRLFDRYRDGLTIAGTLDRLGDVDSLGEPAVRGAVEAAVLGLIADRQGESLEEALGESLEEVLDGARSA